MKLRFFSKLTLPIILIFSFSVSAQNSYFPTKEIWQTKTPEQAKFDAAKLKEAIDFAIASEAKAPRDQELGQVQTFGREPFGEAVGAFKSRGEMTGIIIRNGFIVAEWGEPFRVDMTHSVTKSFITSIVGLAFDRKLIPNLKSEVYKEMSPVLPYNPLNRFDDAEKFGKSKFLELFETEHNKKSLGKTYYSKIAIGKERSGANPIGRTDPTATVQPG